MNYTKNPLPLSVWDAANQRLDTIYQNFDTVTVAFSGGKDSTVLFHLARAAAARNNRPFHVHLIDLEAQYARTVEHVHRMLSLPDVQAHWICLPLHLRNAVSQHQPFWLCWDPTRTADWVRPLPDHPAVISDLGHFPFFRVGMEFEHFVPEYEAWLQQTTGGSVAVLVGIRADESIHRLQTIKHPTKAKWQGHGWTTETRPGLVSAYPIYDWKTEDLWTATGKNRWPYNTIYDLMWKANLRLSQMRLCQPFGDDQKKGLHLFKILEPKTWAKLTTRVLGANSGQALVKTKAFGRQNQILKPAHLTWEAYTQFLLQMMPDPLRVHYEKKIQRFVSWWKDHGYATIPDEADPKEESHRKVPSWRRVARVLVKNDYWCTGLSFAMTKKEHDAMLKRVTLYLEGAKNRHVRAH